jgi:DNA-binding MarR family transcriptional regulator
MCVGVGQGIAVEAERDRALLTLPDVDNIWLMKTNLEHVPSDHSALRAWLRLLDCHNLMETRLRQRLRQEFNISLRHFDLLAHLVRFPQGIRMSELSDLLKVTGGNVTGLVDRMVAEGWIERSNDLQDRRVFLVCMTPKGKALFEQVVGPHEQWVIEMFGGLTPQQSQQLLSLLGAMKQHLTAQK